MSLILATGSNLGDKKQNLNLALKELSKNFKFIAASEIYVSPAVEYFDQPDFYNQVLEFEIPKLSPSKTMELVLNIEQGLGRRRDIPKGPRIIDIDIIFWDLQTIREENLIVPHPSWPERSFVVKPLQQLPYFQIIKKHFAIPSDFDDQIKTIH